MKEHFYNAKIYLTPDIVMTYINQMKYLKIEMEYYFYLEQMKKRH